MANGGSHQRKGAWTSQHQMSLNEKRDNFDMVDLLAFTRLADIKDKKAKRIISEIKDSIHYWQDFAEQAGVRDQHIIQIQRTLRVNEFVDSLT